MSRAPFAPWSWWHGFGDLDWATHSSSSDVGARTSARSPSASASSRLSGDATTKSRTVPSVTSVRLPGAANRTVSPTTAAIAEAAPPPPPVRCTGYVATSGADTNPGTSSAPFRTISHAAAAAGPGDVVCLRAGVYGEKVQLTRSGAPSAPITISAAPNETAVIDGTNLAIDRTDALFRFAAGTNYVTVERLTIRNSTGRGVENGGSHNRVLNTTITGTRSAGLLTTNLGAPATDNEYVGNDISRTVQGNDCLTASDPCRITGGWESAVNQYTAGPHPSGHDLYRANGVHDNGGEGFTLADYDAVVGNTVHDNFSADIYLDGTQHATVEKNLVYESETSRPAGGPSAPRLLAMGIALADENGPRNANNTIRNNIVVNTSTGLDFWQATSGSGLIGDVFDNNTVVNSWNCGICFDAGAHSGTLVRDNLVVPRSGKVTSGVDTRGITALANLFTRDSSRDIGLPGEQTFSSTPNDYRLRPESAPAVDKGIPTSANDDFFGTPRPRGAAYDIGAHELG